LIFGSFHQGKEQRFLFQMKRSYYFIKPYLQKENSEHVNRHTPNSTIKMNCFINDAKLSMYFKSMLYKIIQ